MRAALSASPVTVLPKRTRAGPVASGSMAGTSSWWCPNRKGGREMRTTPTSDTTPLTASRVLKLSPSTNQPKKAVTQGVRKPIVTASETLSPLSAWYAQRRPEKPAKPRRQRRERMPGGPRNGWGSRCSSSVAQQQQPVMPMRTKMSVRVDMFVVSMSHLTLMLMLAKKNWASAMSVSPKLLSYSCTSVGGRTARALCATRSAAFSSWSMTRGDSRIGLGRGGAERREAKGEAVALCATIGRLACELSHVVRSKGVSASEDRSN